MPLPILEVRKSHFDIVVLLIAGVPLLLIGLVLLSLALLSIFVLHLLAFLAFALFGFLFAWPGILFCHQALMVQGHPDPVLTLDTDGLRLNVSGDFIPYAAIRVVALHTNGWIGAVRLDFSAPVMLRYRHFPHGEAGKSAIPRKKIWLMDVYKNDLAYEVELRRKLAQSGREKLPVNGAF